MPVTCTTTALAESSTCYTCISPRMLQAVRILLLCNTINGVTMTCTPDALVEAAAAAGYDQIPPQQANAIEVMLLCTIANTGGGGGGGVNELTEYTGAPVFPSTNPPPPANPLSPAQAYETTGAYPNLNWSTSLQTWF